MHAVKHITENLYRYREIRTFENGENRNKAIRERLNLTFNGKLAVTRKAITFFFPYFFFRNLSQVTYLT